MPRVLLTDAEKSFVESNRYRIELDSRNWNREPFVTETRLREMSPHVRLIFLSSSWERDGERCVWRNIRHAGNADWVERRGLMARLDQLAK